MVHAGTTRTMARGRTRRGRRSRPWVRVASPLSLIALWQLASSTGVLSERTLAAPSTVAAAGRQLLLDGELQHHLLVSLGRVSQGLALGIFLGLVLALIAGLSHHGEELIDAPLQMLRTLPVLALVPLFILWFGIGETPKILLVALATTFPVYLNTFAGIRAVDPRLLEAGESVGLGRLDTIRHVVLPGALPSFLVGLRYSLGLAWLVLVVSEQINASSGIGFLMTQAREFLRTDIIVVGLVVYSLLGLASDVIVRVIERYALAWRPVAGSER